MDGEFWKTLLRLVIFLPLVLFLAYWSIKIGAVKGRFSGSTKNMRLVERVSLSSKASLCVVKVAENYYLLGVAEHQINLIRELPGYQETQEPLGIRKNNWKWPWSKWG